MGMRTMGMRRTGITAAVVMVGSTTPAWAQTSTVFGGILTALQTGVNTAIVTPIATLLTYVAPTGLTLATLYIISYAILVGTGRIAAPAGEAFLRCFKIAVIGLVIGTAGQYQKWVVSPWLLGGGGIPDSLVSAIGGTTGVNTVDVLWGQVATQLSTLFGTLSVYSPVQSAVTGLAMIMIFVIGIVCCAVAFFEIVLAQMSMGMVLMVGPLFIIAAFFSTTQRWFWNWVGEIIHYAVMYVLIGVAGTLVNSLTGYWAGQTQNQPGGTVLTQFIGLMYVALSLVIAAFIFLQAGKIAKSIAGGSSSSGLEAAVGAARRMM